MELTGTVIQCDLQQGVSKAGKEWRKKVFVIEYIEGTSTKHLAFEMFGDEKISSNPVEKGQTVTVSFDVESTEWNGRWFTAAHAWRVSQLGAVVDNNPEPEVIDATPDDLPF